MYQQFIDLMNNIRDINQRYKSVFKEMGFDLELVAVTRLNRWDDGSDDIQVFLVLSLPRFDEPSSPLNRDIVYEEVFTLTPEQTAEPVEEMLVDWIYRLA